MAILSKYPIAAYEEFKLPNPKFEVDNAMGEHWIMHDKFAQFASIQVGERSLNLFNLHYFPVHYFHKSLLDPQMLPSKAELMQYLMAKGLDLPTVIVGDFNNKGEQLQAVFPELFHSGELEEVIQVETTIQNGHDQLDHILYTPKHMSMTKAKADKYLSDHFALSVEITL